LHIVYECFTFINFFRLLLKNGLDHENAMDFMIANCSFSAVVWQEYIHNYRYRRLSAEDAIHPEIAASKAILINDMLEIARRASKSKCRKLNKSNKGK